jgi:hypothetical protein
VAGPEGRVELFLCMLFKQAGWLVYKLTCGGGIADRLLISPNGFHLYIECKRPGKDKLDPAQVAWAKEVRGRIERGARGEHVAVVSCNSRDQARALFAAYRDS